MRVFLGLLGQVCLQKLFRNVLHGSHNTSEKRRTPESYMPARLDAHRLQRGLYQVRQGAHEKGPTRLGIRQARCGSDQLKTKAPWTMRQVPGRLDMSQKATIWSSQQENRSRERERALSVSRSGAVPCPCSLNCFSCSSRSSATENESTIYANHLSSEIDLCLKN